MSESNAGLAKVRLPAQAGVLSKTPHNFASGWILRRAHRVLSAENHCRGQTAASSPGEKDMRKKILLGAAILAVALSPSIPASAEEVTVGPPRKEVRRIIETAPTAYAHDAADKGIKWGYVNVRLSNGAALLVRCRIKPDGLGECENYLYEKPSGKVSSR